MFRALSFIQILTELFFVIKFLAYKCILIIFTLNSPLLPPLPSLWALLSKMSPMTFMSLFFIAHWVQLQLLACTLAECYLIHHAQLTNGYTHEVKCPLLPQQPVTANSSLARHKALCAHPQFLLLFDRLDLVMSLQLK